ncbi:hypothetical protein [Alloyangia pacifica]|uniref:Uncharacterized protein n=1 Tax=Alloyangia pacifica TaxID=311180 RepID=A0A1I6PCN7_9RHOB|nr:hypothetical protein [Alloyangia pacifica]SDG24632.1 hypothetical protein SAMN04488245_102147 [Alloyangia pacifica]SFS37941.1 hypothetical protein SAMN04488050_101448 [Alloyangia pacifica]
MSVTFRILRKSGLVYVRYEGVAQLTETTEAFGNYVTHPDFAPGQKQLVDLSRLTGWDGDFLELMRIQAMKAEAFVAAGIQTMMVYYAPTAVSFELSKLVLRSWDRLDGPVALVQQSEPGCLTLLGMAEKSFAQLLENVN